MRIVLLSINSNLALILFGWVKPRLRLKIMKTKHTKGNPKLSTKTQEHKKENLGFRFHLNNPKGGVQFSPMILKSYVDGRFNYPI